MAINKNHEFEELSGVKCAIVERNTTDERVKFLKEILEHNGFEVVVATSPTPKSAPATKPAEGETLPVADTTSPPETFTVGVTNLAFNPVNAIFGRLLKTKDGHIVTQAYWEGWDTVSRDSIPYFEQPN